MLDVVNCRKRESSMIVCHFQPLTTTNKTDICFFQAVRQLCSQLVDQAAGWQLFSRQSVVWTIEQGAQWLMAVNQVVRQAERQTVRQQVKSVRQLDTCVVASMGG